MPPKKTQLKGGLIDPSSVTLALMKPSVVQNLSNIELTYNSKNYLNIPNGGGKPTQKKAKSTSSTTSGGKKTKTKK
jgi:hypothetical protein